MTGIIFALVTALAWAISSIINKFLTTRIDFLSINMLRLCVGAVILISVVFLTGRIDILLNTQLHQILFIAAAGLIAISIGDTIYIASLNFIDVSRAFPIAQCAFPVLTMFVAIFFLQEPFTVINLVGGFLVVIAIYMVAVLGRPHFTASPDIKKADVRGGLLALMAAVAWTAGAVVLRLGIVEVDPFVAAAIRIPVSAAALSILVLVRKKGEALQFKKYGFYNIALAAAAGVLTYGVAAVAYVYAMQLIGAGKAVIITAIAPILILPLSILILKERITRMAVIGVVIGVAGLMLVSLD
jgi:drug/metabolite transporter (DMT)-like permease